MSSRVLRSAKGKTRPEGEKGLVMGPVQDWGKKSVVICGGTQYTLEDVSAWESLGKFKEVKRALKHAAEVCQKMFNECNSDIHNKWMETEGGEVVVVGVEQLQSCGAELANNFAQGIAMQELTGDMTVVREEHEEEIRDVVYVSGVPTNQYFATPRKDKGKERARNVSPSPASKRKAHGGLSLESIQEGLKDDWSPDKRGSNEPSKEDTSWGLGQLGGRGSFEETGDEAEVLGLQ